MRLGPHHTATCSKWASALQKDLYSWANEKSDNSCGIRILGFPMGFASSLIATAGRIGRVGEVAIKGLANIFGAPFLDECEYMKGLKQIFIQLPQAVLDLFFSPLWILGNLIGDTGGMLVSPKAYSKLKYDLLHAEVNSLDSITDRIGSFSCDWNTQFTLLMYR